MELKEYYDSYKKYKIKKGDNPILFEVLPKVLTIVGRSCKPSEVEDLGQSLICKLCDRFKHWDKNKAQFNTYAYKIVYSNLPEYRLRLRAPVAMIGASGYLYEKLRKIYNTTSLEEFDNIQVEDLKLKIKLSDKTLHILKEMVKSDGDYYQRYCDNYKDQDETDYISLIDERIDSDMLYKTIKKLVKKLSPEEQLLINLYYFGEENDSSYTKVAKKINRSPQFVHKKIKVAMNKIKNMYNDMKEKEC